MKLTDIPNQIKGLIEQEIDYLTYLNYKEIRRQHWDLRDHFKEQSNIQV